MVKDTSIVFYQMPYGLQKKIDAKQVWLIQTIASLTAKNGYCNARNDYFYSIVGKMTVNKLRTGMDYLEKNGLIVRYIKINKTSSGGNHSKRLIALTNEAYRKYHKINPSMHEPISKPKGYMTSTEYSKLLKNDEKKGKNKKPKPSEPPSLKEKSSAEKKDESKPTVEHDSNDVKLVTFNNDPFKESDKEKCRRAYRNRIFQINTEKNPNNWNIDTKKTNDEFEALWNDPAKRKKLMSY